MPEVGDLIFTVKPETDKLKEGDIISYMDGNIAVTHRIIEVQTDADGKRSFVTKGDANSTEDPAVSEDVVFGLYKGRVPGLGDFAMFLQKPLGMAVFIGIPVCAFIIYDIIRRQRSSGRKDKETEALKAELERLQSEIIKSLTGESVFTPEMLKPAIDAQERKYADLMTTLREAEAEMYDSENNLLALSEKFDDFLEWAVMYDEADIAAKKMIISRIIDRVDMHTGYDIKITLNISIEQFLNTIEMVA